MIFLKKSQFLIYKKLFRFSFYYFNNLNLYLSYNILLSFVKIIKFLISIKNFGIFLPNHFKINTENLFSIWVNGLITNFQVIKFYILKSFFLKKLPLILINLTENKIITVEIKKKNLPIINLNNNYFNSNYFIDYFFINNLTPYQITIDNVFFYFFLFRSIKSYQNV